MTIKQLKTLKHGTPVRWRRTYEFHIEEESGYVVDLCKSKPKAEPPLVYIQWNGGQRTDGSDDWALKHVLLESEALKA